MVSTRQYDCQRAQTVVLINKFTTPSAEVKQLLKQKRNDVAIS